MITHAAVVVSPASSKPSRRSWHDHPDRHASRGRLQPGLAACMGVGTIGGSIRLTIALALGPQTGGRERWCELTIAG